MLATLSPIPHPPSAHDPGHLCTLSVLRPVHGCRHAHACCVSVVALGVLLLQRLPHHHEHHACEAHTTHECGSVSQLHAHNGRGVCLQINGLAFVVHNTTEVKEKKHTNTKNDLGDRWRGGECPALGKTSPAHRRSSPRAEWPVWMGWRRGEAVRHQGE